MRKRVSVGDHAPDFTLVSQRGESASLRNYVGKSAVVLFFYPITPQMHAEIRAKIEKMEKTRAG